MNAGQMFMSMIQGVIQPVTPDIPLTALPLAGELRKGSADFAALLSEIRTQSNAKAVSADGIVGAIVQPIGSELQEEFSVSDNSTEVWELSGVETDRNMDSSGIQDGLSKPEPAELDAPRENVFPGGIPENLEMYAAGTQVIAAYAQSGRMPAVDSPPSHEVDTVQNVPVADEPGQQLFARETPAGAHLAEQLKSSPQPSAVQNASPFTSDRQAGRFETATTPTVDKPLLQPAEQTGHNATASSAQRLPQHPDVSASTAQGTKVLPAKTAAPEFVAAAAMEIADSPEATQQAKLIPQVDQAQLESYEQNLTASRQQPGRMPADNSPSSHEVGKVQNVTMDAKQVKQLFAAETSVTTRFAEQAYRSMTAESEHRLALQTALSDSTQLTQSTPQLNVETETNAFVPIQTEAGPAMKVTAESKSITTANSPPPEVSVQKLEASQQQPGRMPLINTPTSHKVDIAQNAERISSVNSDQLEAPVQKLTVPQQQPERMPEVNFSTNHPVNSTQNRAATTIASKLPHVESAAQVPAQPVSVEAARPVTVNQQTGHVETAPAPTTDNLLLQPAEQTFRFVTADPEQQLPQQSKISATTTQAISETAAPAFVQTQTAAALAMEAAVKPEATQQTELTPSVKIAHLDAPVQNPTAPQQQPRRMPVINSPPSQEVDFTQKTLTTPVDAELPLVVPAAQVSPQPLSEQAVRSVPVSQQSGRVETSPVPTSDKPLLQAAEQTYRIATAVPEQPNASASTQATQAITQIGVKTAAPEFLQTQTTAAPVMVAVAEPETAQTTENLPSVNRIHSELPAQSLTVPLLQPGRIPAVNYPPSHDVDSAKNPLVTTVTAALPHVEPVEQFAAQPLSEQEIRPVTVHLQSGRVEKAPISSTDIPVIQKAVHTESLSTVLPEPHLSRSATPASSESEAEIAFSMPRPIVISKAHSTESSRMLQTAAVMRPQIISLDNDQPQNNTAELGTVSAVMSETSSVATAQRHENGRTPEAIFTPSPEIGLTQKVRPEVVTTNTETSVKPSEEANQLKATPDINSAPMQQAVRRVTTQVSPNANSEIVKPDSSQAVAKENSVIQQIAVPAGEAPLASDDSMGNSGDQTWPGHKFDSQMVTNQIHAQSKTEPQTAGTVPNVRNNAEQVRQDLPEQIAHQVRERLTQHEVKPGNQQISLTLTPENMGELKMNLNLQGQRLSVEIVTESRTVRDAIMQHSDSLKESLARQNITVESFDVTSNGRGSGNPGHNSQDAWKELARQKQQQLWTTSGGYRLPQMDSAPNTLAYQAKNEHGMLDIHY